MTSLLAFFVLLGALVTIHELGHFLVAKACGVRVLTFSVGFGPRLIGFRRGETDYRISLLPLGGYVRMYGDDITEEVPPEERHRSFLHQPFLKKSAIAVAGPVFNLLFPPLILLFLFLGVEKVPDAVIGTVLPGTPAAAAGLRVGDRVTGIDGSPVDEFFDIQGLVKGKAGVAVNFEVKDPQGVTRSVTVTPAPAPAGDPLDLDKKVGRVGIAPSKLLPLVVVANGSPAASAGLKDKDRVLSVDGVGVIDREHLWRLLDDATDRAVTLRVSRRPPPAADAATAALEPTQHEVMLPAVDAALLDAPLGLDVTPERWGVTLEDLADPKVSDRVQRTAAALEAATRDMVRRRGLLAADGVVAAVEPGTPAADLKLEADKDRVAAVDGTVLFTASDLHEALTVDREGIHVVGLHRQGAPRLLVSRMAPDPRRGLSSFLVFGVGLAQASGEAPMIERDVGVVEALRRGVLETWNFLTITLRGMQAFVTGKVGLDGIGGPITLFNLSGEAAQQGIPSFIRLMGLISVNLAVLNLLPIPVLDGGHLLMFTIDAVQRRRISVETRMRATKIGLLLVVLLMGVAWFNDILGLVGG